MTPPVPVQKALRQAARNQMAAILLEEEEEGKEGEVIMKVKMPSHAKASGRAEGAVGKEVEAAATTNVNGTAIS